MRPLDLDDHIQEGWTGRLAFRGPWYGMQPSAMNLAQRGGGKRHGIKRGEFCIERAAQLHLGQAPDILKILGRYFILQISQRVGDFRRKNIKTGGQELSHLDHHSSHADGKRPEAEGLSPQSSGTSAPSKRAEPKRPQKQLPEDNARNHSRKEGCDAQITPSQIR
jgi:hypothetical protein